MPSDIPLRSRVLVYEPDGVLRGQLPMPLAWSAAFPLNDLSSMTLEYINAAPGAAMLNAPCELALELSDESGVFTEYPDCRFLNIRQTQDLTQADVTTKLTMPSYGWMLRKVRNINTATFDEEGSRKFIAVTVGAMIRTFITEAHTRGNVPFLNIDFTATVDSAGVAWGSTVTMGVGAGQDLYTLLSAMVAQGQCDFRMNGRTLQLYKPDTFLNRNKVADPGGVILQLQRDVDAAPDDRSYEDIAHTILVQGDEANFVTVEQPINPSPWGEWETFMTQSGVTDHTVMTNLAIRSLQMANAPRTQMTREVIFSSTSPLPLITYRPGDHILAQDETAVMDDLRVRQITLALQGETLKGNIVLGDKFTEQDIRFQRQIAALNGTVVTQGGSGGTPTVPTPPNTDTSVPAQVVGMGLSSATFVDTLGTPRGQISVVWTPVTLSTGGVPQDMQSYRIRYTVMGLTDWAQVTVDAGQHFVFIGDGIQVLKTYTVQVAAVGQNGIQGAWSVAQNVSVVKDSVAPPIPAAPIVTTRLGTVRVHWTGKDADNLPMPPDVDHLNVEIANSGSGPWSGVGAIVSSASDLIVTDLPYNQARWFRLIAVDTSGNVSAASATGTVTVVALVDTDIIGEVINGAHIVDGSLIASEKIVAHSITAGQIAALTITAGEIAANAITADKILAGSITAVKIAAYSIDATRLAIGGSRNLVADPNAANTELGAIRMANANGLPNSATALTWTHESNSFYRVKMNTAGTSYFGRMGWHANSLISPDYTSAANPSTLNPLYVYPVDRSIGGLIAKMAIKTSLVSGTWPPGCIIGVALFCRFVLKDGTYPSSPVLIGTTPVFNAVQDWTTFSTLNGTPVNIPVDAVGMVPYVRVEFANSTTAVLVDMTSIFISQVAPGVLIEDGSITANKIVAGSITTSKLAADSVTATNIVADALTVKHTITGSTFQTSAATNTMRVIISPNANYLGQAGMRLLSGGAGARDASLWIDSGAASGGWPAYSTTLNGPEVTRNSSGRADLNMQVGGGFYIKKAFVDFNNRWAGIETVNNSNEILFGGTIPRGTALGDGGGAIRAFSSSFQNGTVTWGNDNGWTYRGAVCPNSPAAVPRYGCMQSTSNTTFTWNCSGTVDAVDLWLYRGGYVGA